ncbi:hypothetical protein OS42_44300 [Dickeya oryzae]
MNKSPRHELHSLLILKAITMVFIIGYSINVAFAENPSVIGNWNMTKETSYPSTCEEPQIELFFLPVNFNENSFTMYE